MDWINMEIKQWVMTICVEIIKVL